MLLVGMVSACATPSATDLVIPLGSTCTQVAVIGNGAPHQATPPPYEAQQLVEAVTRIASGSLDRQHVAETLLRLADALVIVAPAEIAEVDEIRRAANELLRGGRVEENPIHIALVATLSALQSAQPFFDHDREPFRHAVAMLAVVLETVPADAPWHSQHDDEVVALRQATRAIYVAIGARPPFEPQTIAGVR